MFKCSKQNRVFLLMILETVSPNMSLGFEIKDFSDSNLFRISNFEFQYLDL